MDKILDDMRKKFETEQKQVVSTSNNNEDNELMSNSESTNLNQEQQQQSVHEDQNELIKDNQSETNKTADYVSEKVANCDYIETSTPYQSNDIQSCEHANESELMLQNERIEVINNMQIDQIDSIKSNNRENDSSDDKTNELSDTAEEIETFTRKETTQYRVLSMPENENNLLSNLSDQQQQQQQQQISESEVFIIYFV